MRCLAPRTLQSRLSYTHVRGASRFVLNRLQHHQSRRHRFCSAIGANFCGCAHNPMSHAQVHQEVLNAVLRADQGHLLAGWDSLTEDQRARLTCDIQVGKLQSQRTHIFREFSCSLHRGMHAASLFCRQLIWHMPAEVTMPARL